MEVSHISIMYLKGTIACVNVLYKKISSSFLSRDIINYITVPTANFLVATMIVSCPINFA